jgi:bifunctional DNA-binding transcriptional regulator/antitoxin component of YhaV-PrlF toxin-antitoxin module
VTDSITIEPSGEHRYAVTLHDGASQSVHQVVVPSHLLAELGLGPDDEALLVRASFEFLVEREPASSILRRFELDVIGRYFPEYLDTIRRRLASPKP